VRLFPEKREIETIDTYEKKVLVSIEYQQKHGGKIENLYKIQHELDNLFGLDIKIADRNILIEKTKYKISPDEVGSTLSFLVYIRYSDKINKNEKEYETVENVDIKYTRE